MNEVVAVIAVFTVVVTVWVPGVIAGVGAAATEIVTVEVAVSLVTEALVAVTVYEVDALVLDGVPEITPVDELIDRPAGNDGEIV